MSLPGQFTRWIGAQMSAVTAIDAERRGSQSISRSNEDTIEKSRRWILIFFFKDKYV
jgi:hypothetical protein